jgi:hypothetical protein
MIYVDNLFGCKPTSTWPYMQACHLMGDSEEELHTFAASLGLLRCWYQRDHVIPHYDLTPRMRALAVRLGAQEIASQDEYRGLMRKGQEVKVVPFGYAGRGMGALERLMGDDPHTHVVDIRMSPRSQYMPDFNKVRLQARFPGRYVHMPELGNVNYNNDLPIEIAAPGRGIARLINGLNKGYTLILLCACKDEGCHRWVVVDLLKQAMPEARIEMPVATSPRDNLKCLSVQQPWAWLIVNGFKDVENRDWATSYRGPVLIHAGSRVDGNWFNIGELYDRPLAALDIVPHFDMPERQQDYPTRAIVGMATLVDVVTASTSPWFVGRYGFIFIDAKPFNQPVPYSGSLKLFDVEREVLAEVSYA